MSAASGTHQSVRSDTLRRILAEGVIAVIRMKEAGRLLKVVEAIRNGGVQCIEITMTVPGAVGIITELVRSAPSDVLVGAGTVTDVDTAKRVIDAGARFVVGPILSVDVIQLCHASNTIVIPGCYSPTEIYAAWKAGGDIIKVFPASTLGPRYFKDLKGPLPDIPLMPTGGVTIENVGEWIEAGAAAVAIGTDLLDKRMIDQEQYELLTQRAQRLIQNYQHAKQSQLKR